MEKFNKLWSIIMLFFALTSQSQEASNFEPRNYDCGQFELKFREDTGSLTQLDAESYLTCSSNGGSFVRDFYPAFVEPGMFSFFEVHMRDLTPGYTYTFTFAQPGYSVKTFSFTYGTVTGADTVGIGSSSQFNWDGSTNNASPWYSSDPSIATVDAISGVVTGVSPGIATIYYNTYWGGFDDGYPCNKTVTVVPEPHEASNFEPRNYDCGQFELKFREDTGSLTQLDAESYLTCSSNGGSFVRDFYPAFVEPGMFSFFEVHMRDLTPGYTYTFTFAQPGYSVKTFSFTYGTVTGADTVGIGSSSQFNWDGSTNNASPWYSSDPSIATVDAISGVVTGVSPGIATIYYNTYWGGFDDGYPCNKTVSVSNLSTDIFTKQNVLIYPNPTKNQITIKGEFDYNESIIIYNVLGQKVIEKFNITNEEKIDVSLLSRGLYNVYFNTSRVIYKFIKE